MNMMKMCLNPKVLGGLAVVAVGLFVFAPEVALAALPVLLALACPLSMVGMALFMGKGMKGMGAAQSTGGAASYTCPVHPQVQSATPGSCPTCGMALVPGAAPTPAREAPAGTAAAREERVSQLQAELRQVQGQQVAIAQEIAALDGAPKPGQDGRGRGAQQVVPDSHSRGEGA